MDQQKGVELDIKEKYEKVCLRFIWLLKHINIDKIQVSHKKWFEMKYDSFVSICSFLEEKFKEQTVKIFTLDQKKEILENCRKYGFDELSNNIENIIKEQENEN